MPIQPFIPTTILLSPHPTILPSCLTYSTTNILPSYRPAIFLTHTQHKVPPINANPAFFQITILRSSYPAFLTTAILTSSYPAFFPFFQTKILPSYGPSILSLSLSKLLPFFQTTILPTCHLAVAHPVNLPSCFSAFLSTVLSSCDPANLQ